MVGDVREGKVSIRVFGNEKAQVLALIPCQTLYYFVYLLQSLVTSIYNWNKSSIFGYTNLFPTIMLSCEGKDFFPSLFL